MSDTCSHQTIAEWTALYAERDRLERLWKSAEIQAEKTDDAYVAAVEQRDALRVMLGRLLDVALVDGYGETVADEARVLLGALALPRQELTKEDQ